MSSSPFEANIDLITSLASELYRKRDSAPMTYYACLCSCNGRLQRGAYMQLPRGFNERSAGMGETALTVIACAQDCRRGTATKTPMAPFVLNFGCIGSTEDRAGKRLSYKYVSKLPTRQACGRNSHIELYNHEYCARTRRRELGWGRTAGLRRCTR